MSEVNFTRYKLVSIDAWGTDDGLWEWNQHYTLEEGIMMGDDYPTTRRILKDLRKWGYLGKNSQGLLRVEFDWDGSLIEIQQRSNSRPVMAFMEDPIWKPEKPQNSSPN